MTAAMGKHLLTDSAGRQGLGQECALNHCILLDLVFCPILCNNRVILE